MYFDEKRFSEHGAGSKGQTESDVHVRSGLGRRFRVGYLGWTLGVVIVLLLRLVTLPQPGFVFVGAAMALMMWAPIFFVAQLLILFLEPNQPGYIGKCLGLTLFNAIILPILIISLLQYISINKVPPPDYERALAMENPQCRIVDIDKKKRKSRDTFYMSGDLRCAGAPGTIPFSWWFSYDNKTGKWERSPTRRLPAPAPAAAP